MRRSTALMSVAAVAFMASSALAQKTNANGTWQIVVDSAAAAQQQAAAGGGGMGGRGGRGGGGGFGQTFTATQDASKLTITRTMGQNDVVSTYNLDGSDSKNMVQGRGGATEVVSHAKWDGDKIVISTTRDMNGMSMTTTQTLSSDAAGNLWVETSRPGQGGAMMTSKVEYKKGIPVKKDGN
jgi:hypothetical protein